MSLLTTIAANSVRHASRTAVIDDRRRYSYGQLLGGAMFLAEKLEQSTARSNIGVLLPTSGTFPLTLLAAWLARKTAVPFNYLLQPEELAYVIKDSGVDAIVTAGLMIDFLGAGKALPALGGVRLIKLDDVDFKGFPPLRWPPLPSRDETAVILYTSGTSAKPKGVELTHGNLEHDVWAAIEHARITSADKFLGVLPQFHSFGLTALTLIPLAVGATVVYSARFIPKKIMQLIREHRPEMFMAVPSMYGALANVKDVTADDFKSIRIPVSGGEPLAASVYEDYLDRLNLKLLEGYGLTETSPVLTWSAPHKNRRKSVGTALPGIELLIVDDNDRPLPDGEDGEILARGPTIMKGYYKLPEVTRGVMTKIAGTSGGEPWFRTGDIGHLDAEGFLFITGRKKEMLKVAGEIVVPREVEDCLRQHPSVKDACVIGKPDELRGEVPFGFVEIKEGETFDETALRTWCRDRLANFKVPREIRRIDALPRNPTGKVMRRLLKPD